MQDGALNVPDEPVVHYIEGDGIGIDITPVMINVVNASVAKAYGGSKQIHWSEVLAGEKAFNATGEWLPEATLDAMRSGLVSIKGPLPTPVGGGIRRLRRHAGNGGGAGAASPRPRANSSTSSPLP